MDGRDDRCFLTCVHSCSWPPGGEGDGDAVLSLAWGGVSRSQLGPFGSRRRAACGVGSQEWAGVLVTHRCVNNHAKPWGLNQQSLCLLTVWWLALAGGGLCPSPCLSLSWSRLPPGCPQGPWGMTGQLQASGPLHALSLSSVGHSESRVPLDGRTGGRWPIEGARSSQACLW